MSARIVLGMTNPAQGGRPEMGAVLQAGARGTRRAAHGWNRTAGRALRGRCLAAAVAALLGMGGLAGGAACAAVAPAGITAPAVKAEGRDLAESGTPAAGTDSAATVAPASPLLRSGNWHTREGMYFQRNWGVDIVGVRRVASGYMLRLSYRIVDPAKAKPLFEKKSAPYVIDEVSGAHLAVPAMENIGELRQTAAPVEDRTYFMIFGNPEKLVQRGGRVSIVIGNFRVDGFPVD